MGIVSAPASSFFVALAAKQLPYAGASITATSNNKSGTEDALWLNTSLDWVVGNVGCILGLEVWATVKYIGI